MFKFFSDKLSKVLGSKDKDKNETKENISQKDQQAMAQKMMSGDFTLKDFEQQMAMASKLGSLQKMARFVPGMGKVSPEMMKKGQEEMKRFKLILSAMTDEEKLNPHILDAVRKRRIASQAGVSVQEIDQLLQKFEQSKQFVKMLKKGR